MNEKQMKIARRHLVIEAIAISSVILFIFSSIRHWLFQSNFDLAIFDNVLYLISQGQTPISQILGFHILGDHAAFIFYPLALFYKIQPNVHWLFAIQAIALAIGALPILYLALNAGLKKSKANTIAISYLLYPLIFNVNLADFHPEVIALPAILWAVLAARINSVWQFCVAIALILSCKAVLALTVALMGVWLFIFEKRRLYGAIAIVFGISWFIISNKIIIPWFGRETASLTRHLYRYGDLGNSYTEILKNLIFQPGILLSAIFNLTNLSYLLWLFLPVVWGIAPKHLTPLISTIPALLLNLLATSPTQKSLTHQYSLPILPFLFLVVISTLACDRGWLRSSRGIILWSLGAFLVLAKFGYFGSIYLDSLDTWQATRDALTQINTQGSILTTTDIAPHLTHRSIVKIADRESTSANLDNYNYVLLNLRHPGWSSSEEIAKSLIDKLQISPEFKLSYRRDDVFLFKNSSQ
ncbi:MAG: DUF2079 domain-containing protein [Xenococcaceae cyanobacterium]